MSQYLGLPEGCTTVVVVRRAQTLDFNIIFVDFPLECNVYVENGDRMTQEASRICLNIILTSN